MNLSEDFKLQQVKLKENIQFLIECNKLEEASNIIAEYETMINNDIDVYSFKAVIAIMQNRNEDAMEILLKALDFDVNNADILYNLGYIFESKKEYKNAYTYYRKAKKNTKDEQLMLQIDSVMHELEKLPVIQDYIKSKKVLFIAYYFPPIGSSGVQRSLKYVKYLKQYGWDPIVVTVKNDDSNTIFTKKDETFLNEIPDETQIVRIDMPTSISSNHIKEVIDLACGLINDKGLKEEYFNYIEKYKTLDFILRPDVYILWANNVIKQIEKCVDFDDIDIIYTTSSPYSDHVAGFFLKQHYNKPWVADFRDEWSNNCYARRNKNDIIYKFDYSMEEKIVNYADKIITTTPLSSDNYRNIFNLDNEKVITITNGYDEDDFQNLEIISNNDKFTMIHNGVLYSVRTPETFFQAVSNLLKKGLIDKNKFKIYMGPTDDDDRWKKLSKELLLEDNIEFLGYLNHKDSLRLAAKVDSLLLIVGSEKRTGAVYPGKLFEYLRLNKPILSLSPIGGVVDKLIKDLDRGFNIEFLDVEGIEKAYLNMYQMWKDGKLKSYNTTENIMQFDRKVLTKRLVALFDELTNKDTKNIELIEGKN
ncbi:glycosyltransferase [Pseudoclostridium thermosuccinogenes]|uniref:glycosyltransferase n=1 Tax=Clostridium thermosuccinogenes TaxID=84032 RepID=UPI002FDACFE8